MEDFEDLSKETCRQKFMELRKKFNKAMEKADFLEKQDTFNKLFDEITIDAVEGDVIAQDFLAYLHKKGRGDFLPVNMEASMNWQILSAANGNGFDLHQNLAPLGRRNRNRFHGKLAGCVNLDSSHLRNHGETTPFKLLLWWYRMVFKLHATWDKQKNELKITRNNLLNLISRNTNLFLCSTKGGGAYRYYLLYNSIFKNLMKGWLYGKRY